MKNIKSSVYKLKIRVLFLSVAMSAAPGLSHAAHVYVNSYATTAYNQITENTVESYSNPVTTSSSSNYGGGVANSMAYAGFGVLKVSGQASGVASSESLAGGASHSTASFEDDVNILAKGVTGNAIVTANLLVSGHLVAGSDDPGANDKSANSATGQFVLKTSDVLLVGHSSVTVQLGLEQSSNRWISITPEGTIEGLDMFRLYTFNIPIQLGADFSLSVSLDGLALATADKDGSKPGVAFASYDLGHSLYWAGISALRDANGNLITDYSLTSGSGVDYRNSLVPVSTVPLPAAVWLFFSGILGMGFASRRSA